MSGNIQDTLHLEIFGKLKYPVLKKIITLGSLKSNG